MNLQLTLKLNGEMLCSDRREGSVGRFTLNMKHPEHFCFLSFQQTKKTREKNPTHTHTQKEDLK